jgi:predicted regulator of amino acid metabolism with ACT domain
MHRKSSGDELIPILAGANLWQRVSRASARMPVERRVVSKTVPTGARVPRLRRIAVEEEINPRVAPRIDHEVVIIKNSFKRSRNVFSRVST